MTETQPVPWRSDMRLEHAPIKELAARPMRFIPVRVAMFCAALTLSLAPGCKSPTHAEAKIQAEQRWGKVRGQVKTQLARQQFERGLFEDAIKTLKEATALDGSSAETYALLTKANLELGKATTAEQVLAKAEKLGLASAELTYLKGVVLEQRNELETALSQYEKAHAADPTKANYVIAQIETLVSLDRAEEALKLADESTGQFDEEASLAVLGARIALLNGDTEGAMRRLQHPSVTSSGNLMATEQLGLLMAERNQCSEAIRLLESVIEGSSEAGPSNATRRSLAHCYLQRSEPAKAVQVLLMHDEKSEDDRSLQLLLAKAALMTDEYMIALQAIENLKRNGKPQREVELLHATILWKKGDLDAAERVLRKVLAKSPDDLEGLCLLGEILTAQGRVDLGQEAFGKALSLDPANQWAARESKAHEDSNNR